MSFSDMYRKNCACGLFNSLCCSSRTMKQLTPEQKHSLLTHYASRCKGETLEQIFSLHGVKTTRQSFFSWQQQWDGTVASLSRAAGSGRPRVLTSGQVKRHVATRIRTCNRSGVAVRYTKLLPQVQAATGQHMSIQTLRRYGKQELHAKMSRGTKRSADEGTLTHMHTTSLHHHRAEIRALMR